jgi:TolB protein
MTKRASFRILLVVAVGLFFATERSAVGRTSKHGGVAAKGASRQTGAPIPGQIAYVGQDANIYLCAAPCDQPACITCAAKAEQARANDLTPASTMVQAQVPAPPVQYNWPTFSPDGHQIAYSSARRGGAGTFGVHSYDLARRASISIFESSDRPIYFSWLPGGHQLFFLASDDESLKLIRAEAHENRPVRIILTGQPLFFDWNQALDELAFHYVESTEQKPEHVGLMKITDHDQRVIKTISTGPAPFRNPAWSPDQSHLAYVVDNKNGQVTLVVANADGSSPREMVGLAPGVSSFVWAPDSKRIAFATQKSEGKMAYDGINLLDVANGNINPLVSEPVIAYFFSPDGQRLAYIGVTEQSNTWNVVDLASGKSRKLTNFVASHTQSITYQVFDQYAISHRVWSPDSRALVFAGVMVKAGVAVPLEAMPPPSIWMLPVDGGSPQDLADGDVAFWSPVR